MIELVLFDLGGVLIEIPAGVPGATAADEAERDELWRRWLSSEWVRRFESGRCSPTEFAAGMVADWALPTTPDQYLAGFRDWLIGLAPGADDLVAALVPGLRKGCLSNSNVVHWPRKCSEMRICELLDEYYLSFELGECKPDPGIYDLTVARAGLAPAQILFLDDNQLNVAGARSCGIQAERVRGVAEARRVLTARGLVSTGSTNGGSQHDA